MSHNARIYADAFYANGVPYPATAWQTLDTTITKVVHEGGGTWSPAAGIAIGGAGMWCAGPWTLSVGASVQASYSGAKYITHGDSDYMVLPLGHTGNTRTIGTCFGRGQDVSNGTAKFILDAPGTGGALNYAVTSSAMGGRLVARLQVHNGARFTQGVFHFRVGSSHMPQNFPQFRIYKADTKGVVTALNSSPVLISGFAVYPTPANGAAYYNSGYDNTLTYTIDANTVIDTTKFTYFAEVIDESGTGALSANTFTSVVSTFASIQDMRPQ